MPCYRHLTWDQGASDEKETPASADVLAVALALTALGPALHGVGRQASAVVDAGSPVAGRLTSPPLIPRVTVIVDNLPSLRSPTGITLDSVATTAWVTEQTVDDGRLRFITLEVTKDDLNPLGARTLLPRLAPVARTAIVCSLLA